MIEHSIIEINNGKIHIAQDGSPNSSPLLFLHGWPENWKAYERVIELACTKYFAVAIDLPGIGESVYPNAPFLKIEIAKVIHKIVEKLKLKNLTIVGHDVGGQIAFSYLHEYPKDLKAAVIMDVVIPGLNPWEEVLRNPYIWHFAFHSIPKLPETLVNGKQKDYFEFFYNAIAAHPEKISSHTKENYIRAYSSPESLTTGFNWYRGFSEDVKYNKKLIEQHKAISTPLLYMRGDRSFGKIEQYASGFADAGLLDVTAKIVPDSGHFMVEEQPELVWEFIEDFLN